MTAVRLVTFRTEGGDNVTVQVADDGVGSSGIVTRGFGAGPVVEQSDRSLGEMLARVDPAVSTLLAQLRTYAEAPAQIELQFGIQVSMEVGAFIASGSTSANFQVTLRWVRD